MSQKISRRTQNEIEQCFIRLPITITCTSQYDSRDFLGMLHQYSKTVNKAIPAQDEFHRETLSKIYILASAEICCKLSLRQLTVQQEFVTAKKSNQEHSQKQKNLALVSTALFLAALTLVRCCFSWVCREVLAFLGLVFCPYSVASNYVMASSSLGILLVTMNQLTRTSIVWRCAAPGLPEPCLKHPMYSRLASCEP